MTPANRVVVVAVASLTLQASIAHAQSAGAEALFREGRTLIKSGDLDGGCSKLDASEKLESSVGTLLNLGDCREKQGRYATAWAAFRKAEAMAKRAGNDKKRQREAGKRANKLEGSLATITIQVGEKATHDGLVVTRDGEALDTALWGTAIVVDPGQHTIVAEAPGAKPWTSTVSVGKGGKRWVVVPTLEREPEPVAVTPPVAAKPPVVAPPRVVPPRPRPIIVTTPPPSANPPPPTTVVTHTWGPTRGLAVGLAVVGLGAIGGGIYVGQRSRDLEDEADAICPNIACNDAEALRINDDAQTAAQRANIFFIAGGAAVAVASVLWIVGKPDAETVIAPSIGDGHVGASLARRF